MNRPQTTVSGSVVWRHEHQTPDQARFRVGVDNGEVVADWEGFATLRAARDGSRHELTLPPGLPSPQADKFRSTVRALLRHLQGRVTLHGSAIALQGLGVVFLGPSGSGKSTAAADISCRLGAQLLSDDLVELEQVDGAYTVSATDSAHWLFPDSARRVGFSPTAGTWKSPLEARSRRTASSVPLRALVSLAFEDCATVPTLTSWLGHRAFHSLNGAMVRFVTDDPAILLRDFDAICGLCRATPLLALVRRRDFDDLDKVARVLLDYLDVTRDATGNSTLRGTTP